MKLSSNTVGILVIIGLATAAFVWMAKRPAIEGNALVLGMPSTQEAAPVVTDVAKDAKAPATTTEPVTETETLETIEKPDLNKAEEALKGSSDTSTPEVTPDAENMKEQGETATSTEIPKTPEKLNDKPEMSAPASPATTETSEPATSTEAAPATN